MLRRCHLFVSFALAALVVTPRIHAQILGDNIAWSMPATRSSQLGGFSPDLAVNGNYGDFTHTLADAFAPDPEWWQVDLGFLAEVGFVVLLNFLFLGGPEPPCLDAADVNDDGVLNITTGVYVFNWLFLGGPLPPAPGPTECGPDPTDDTLDCAAYNNC